MNDLNNTAAINKFVKDFSREPSRADIAFTIGLLYMDDADYADAEDWFSKSYSLDPSYSVAYYFSAFANICLDRYERAADIWDLFMKTEKCPFDFHARMRLPFKFDFEKLKRKSFSLCKNRRNLLPNDLPPVYLSALTHLFAGDVEQALSLLESMLDKEPPFKTYYMLLSEIYSRRGDVDNAIRILSLLWAKHPDFMPVPLKLAYLYDKKNDYANSAVFALKAFGLKENAQSLLLAARAFIASGRNELALEFLEVALFLDENNEEIYAELGKVAFLQGDFLSSFLFMKKLSDINSSSPYAAFYKGRIFQEWGSFREAVYYYYASLDLGLIDPEVHRLLSDSLYEIGEYEEAAYQRLVFINLSSNVIPDDVRDLSVFLEKAELFAESAAIMEKHLEERPESFKLLYLRLALLYLRLGDKDRACLVLKQAAGAGISSPYSLLLSKILSNDFSSLEVLKRRISSSFEFPSGLSVGYDLSADEKEFLALSFLSLLPSEFFKV